MRIIQLNGKVLLEAEEGFQLRRKADGWIAGSYIYLGMTFYINGEALAEPIQSLPEHYEEIPMEGYHLPEEEEPQEETPVEEEPIDFTELESAIKAKVKASNAYAETLKVITFNGRDFWKTPEERDNYLSTLMSAKRLGINEVSFMGVMLEVDKAINLLDVFNIWAYRHGLARETHEMAIKALTSIEDVENYDFTTGYPEKISISSEKV